jgi:hypothetical protein
MTQPELNLGETRTYLLTGTKKTIIEVDYDDVDEAVSKFLIEKGVKLKKGETKFYYESVAYQEWSNSESHDFDVSKKLPTPDKQQKILNGDLMWSLRTILDWMCAEERIEPANYYIAISW